MSTSLPQAVHDAEKGALIEEGGLECVLPYAAVVELDAVLRTPSLLRSEHPCVLRPLPGVPKQKALVQHCPTLGYRFLWCHVDNNSYRRHYVRFLQHEYKWGRSSLPRDWHVDHAFNRARARDLELNWVRMMLLPGSINMSHGAGYEKGRTRSPIPGTAGRDRKLDEVTLAKASGLKSPRRGEPLSAELEAYARRIAHKHGLPAQVVIDNIYELLAI